MFKLPPEERARIIEKSRVRADTVEIPRAWLDLLLEALSAEGRDEEALQALKMKESSNG